MKITICGSINHSDKMIEIADKLEKLGHQIELPLYTQKIKNGEVTLENFVKVKEKKGDASFRQSAKEDLIKRYYHIIEKSDCVLIVNIDKNNIKNYIGGNSFLEMGFAYILDKPIFLMNGIPQISYRDEILAMKPIILNNDLTRIK